MRENDGGWQEWVSVASAKLDAEYRKQQDEAAYQRFRAKLFEPVD